MKRLGSGRVPSANLLKVVSRGCAVLGIGRRTATGFVTEPFFEKYVATFDTPDLKKSWRALKPKADRPYDLSYYANLQKGSLDSARLILPLSLQPFKALVSVMDCGVGSGAFLQVAAEQGFTVLHGVDGAWAPDPHGIIAHRIDIEGDGLEDLLPAEKFDVAFCLETAEHLSTGLASDWSTR